MEKNSNSFIIRDVDGINDKHSGGSGNNSKIIHLRHNNV